MQYTFPRHALTKFLGVNLQLLQDADGQLASAEPLDEPLTR